MRPYENNEFEAVKLRFESQTELLHRLTQIDLRVFSGFITLQLVLGAWLATHGGDLISELKLGLGVIDGGMAFVVYSLLHNNALRRNEVVENLENCKVSLGYNTPGVYLEGKALDTEMEFRPWKYYYYVGIAVSLVGVFLVLVNSS